ncbi:hypothetical protein LCGC14_2849620 [marine sediment metagenome]|uniref:Uncharacterized protein n=1 Tax=marine sediment metagenome TaxID=412755 RepID=A0A0F9AH17_9ZZZZ
MLIRYRHVEYESTGEWRKPKVGEYYLTSTSNMVIVQEGDDGKARLETFEGCRAIFRRVPLEYYVVLTQEEVTFLQESLLGFMSRIGHRAEVIKC